MFIQDILGHFQEKSFSFVGSNKYASQKGMMFGGIRQVSGSKTLEAMSLESQRIVPKQAGENGLFIGLDSTYLWHR